MGKLLNQGGWSPGHHPIGDRSNGVLCVGGAKDGVSRSPGGKGGSFTCMDGYFSGRFCRHFWKNDEKHHRTECDLSAGHGRSSAPVLTWRTSH